MGNDDQQAQVQMLLQQGNNQAPQQPQPQQSQGPQQAQNQHAMQMANQNQQGLNAMGNNMFQRNFPLTQDTSSTLTMTMQNYIQSQQASQQQLRAQQHVAQQQQQPQPSHQQPQAQAQQQPQQQQQAAMMRSQFNISQNQANQTNLNPMNPSNLYANQQQYAANLAAVQQRQGGLSTLNQPINPVMQPQHTLTPQQRPAQFPQIPDSNALKDPSMFNPQLRNPLQSPDALRL